jgi:hypothetical protein
MMSVITVVTMLATAAHAEPIPQPCRHAAAAVPTQGAGRGAEDIQRHRSVGLAQLRQLLSTQAVSICVEPDPLGTLETMVEGKAPAELGSPRGPGDP